MAAIAIVMEGHAGKLDCETAGDRVKMNRHQ